jgi:hypothetical protein
LEQQPSSAPGPLRRIALVTLTIVAVIVAVSLFFGDDDDDAPTGPTPVPLATCPLPPRPVTFLGELVQTPITADSVATLDAVPEGQPPDQQTTQAIEATIDQYIDCSNSGDVLRWLSLYSDGYLRRVFDPEDELSADTANQLIDSIATPESIAAEAAITLIAIREMVQLPDGRVAVVLETDGGDPNPEGPDVNLFVLADQGGRWIIDDAVDDIDEDSGERDD